MRPFLFILSAMVLMSLAFWAYRENYATQRALKDVSNLNREIAGFRESLSQQRAEWAYLNRPARLRDLVALNFDSLGLLPMESGQFSRIDQVAFPLPPIAAPELGSPIETMGDVESGAGAFETPADAPAKGSEEPL